MRGGLGITDVSELIRFYSFSDSVWFLTLSTIARTGLSYVIGLIPGTLLLTKYTWAVSTPQPTDIAMAMIGRLVRAKSNLRTRICFRARMSLQSKPARDALKAAENAP